MMNCSSYAFNAWHEHGGALRFVRSSHWLIPHILHEAQDGAITHYVPYRTLDKPIHSLLGFDGKVRKGDNVKRGPMPMHGIVAGAWLLALMATWWAVGKLWRRVWA